MKYATFLLLTGLLSFGWTQHQSHPFFIQIASQWANYQAGTQAEKVYLHLDRKWYEPGEVVWFKAYLRDAFTHRATAGSDFLRVELLNPRGERIAERRLWLKAGSAAGEFTLAADWPGGRYTLRAFTNWQRNTDEAFTREIVLQKAVLPRLKLQLDLARKTHGPGSPVRAHFSAETLTNTPLADEELSYRLAVAGQMIATGKLRTDARGKATISTKLPADLQRTEVLLSVSLRYKDRPESISRAVPVVLNDIDLQFLPEGGEALVGQENTYGFKALNEFGKPADIAGEIVDAQGTVITTFRSFHQGMGKISLTPRPGQRYFAQLTAPTKKLAPFPLPQARAQGLQLMVHQHDARTLTLGLRGAAYRDSVFIVGQSMGQQRYQQALLLRGETQVTIPISAWPQGLATFTLYDASGSPRSERLVFLHPHAGLRVHLKPLAAVEGQRTNSPPLGFLPRQKVELDIHVTDRQGNPVQGDFSLAVVNDNLLTFADDKQGHLLAKLLLQSELRGTVEEPNFYFDSTETKAIPALDLLMLTQGWRRLDWQAWESDRTNYPYPHEHTDIAGIVLTTEGKPVANARVQLIPYERLVFTAADGSFCIPEVPLKKEGDLLITSPQYQGQYRVRDYKNRPYVVYPSPYTWGKARAATNTEIGGQAVALATGEPLLGVTVQLYLEDVVVGAQSTDTNGNFNFSKLLPGNYRIHAAYLGCNNIMTEPRRLSGGSSQEVQLRFHPTVTLEEVVVREYKVPLIEQDNTTQGARLSSDQIEVLSSRNRNALAAAPIKEDALDFAEQAARAEPVRKRNVLALRQPPPPVIEEVPNESMAEPGAAVPPAPRPRALAAIVPPPPPPPPPPPAVKEIFKVVEEMPFWKACEGLSGEARQQCTYLHVMQFVQEHFEWPPQAQQMDGRGTIVIRFVVEKDGTVTDVRAIRNIGAGLGQEAERVIKLMNTGGAAWHSGRQRGRPVRVQYNLPIRLNPEVARYVEVPRQLFQREDRHRPQVNSFYQSRQFYAPRYETSAERAQPQFDHRTTLHWEPMVRTDENGRARINFYTADDITSYRITLEGLAVSGQAAHGLAEFYTQSSLTVQARWPERLAVGDTVLLPVLVENHSKVNSCGDWTWELPAGLRALSLLPDTICLNAGSFRNLDLPIVALQPLSEGELRLRLTTANYRSDWAHPVRIDASGYPQEQVFSGSALKQKFTVDLPEIKAHSLHVSLKAFTSPLDEIMDGLERMLRQPRGCFEQVSSSNYPNLLVMDLLRRQPAADPASLERARTLLQAGYEKLVSYESPSGGFHWWGSDPGHEALTAYGILQFVDMQAVFPVDAAMIERAADWLLARRDGQGSWQQGSRHLHTWVTGPGVRDAFIVWALSEAGMASRIPAETDYALKMAREAGDSYSIALMANSLLAADDERAAELVQWLIEEEESASWEGASTSVVCSSGKALQVETTALTALAIMRQYGRHPLVPRAIQWLQGQRSSYGFGHTQSTVLALKAMAAYARQYSQPTTDGTIVVEVDGSVVSRLAYEKGGSGPLELNDLASSFNPAERQVVRVYFEGTQQAIPFVLSVNYHALQPPSDPACPLRISTHLVNPKLEVGEYARLIAKVSNPTAELAPAPLVQIGIPAGLSLQAWQLKQLMEDQVIDYYEIFDGYLVCYFEQLAPQSTRELALDLKADLAGQYAGPASSAHLYYGNGEQQWAAPLLAQVLQ